MHRYPHRRATSIISIVGTSIALLTLTPTPLANIRIKMLLHAIRSVRILEGRLSSQTLHSLECQFIENGFKVFKTIDARIDVDPSVLLALNGFHQ